MSDTVTGGRRVPPPLTHTFPSGDTATVRPLSQFTIANLAVAAQKRLPKPQPPLAPGVGGELEPNPADPAYAETVARWEEAVGLLVNDLILEVALDLVVDDERLEHLRRTMARIDAPIDEVSDKVAYLKHICLAGLDDVGLRDAIVQLLSLITGKAQPSEADVQAHVETFPSDVGGA